jgi:hypothetical protein
LRGRSRISLVAHHRIGIEHARDLRHRRHLGFGRIASLNETQLRRAGRRESVATAVLALIITPVNATTAKSDASGRTTFGERGGEGERPLKTARVHPGKAVAGYHALGRSGAGFVAGVHTIVDKADESWPRP